YHLIASGIPGRETTYLWQVPNISSDSCKIRIVAYGPGWQFDESDGVFRIRETGIKEEISKTFHIDISRNLMKDEIRLNIDNLEDDLEIEIYNLSGRLIKNYYVKPAQKVILILDRKKERIPRGIYFLKLSSKNYQKIIKFIF
ncbi:MAG: T9SS type A sorting domain-containing protein, partial [candidate division WOR-3 bacterium]